MKARKLRFGSTMVLAFLSAVHLGGQVNTTATLRGTVFDKTQRVISGAEVRLVNNDTGLSRRTSSNAEGVFVFNIVPPSHYRVRISVRGFSTVAFDDIELTVGRTTTIDAVLVPSSRVETVTVESNTSTLVDVQKTDISRLITPTEVEDIPLNGRDFVNLSILAPGARPVPSYDSTKARIGVFATNGSSGRNVNVTVNGIDNKDGTVGGPVIQLPLEAIREFNIATQRFSASNGRSEGAVVNVVTKSGTNSLHGALYLFDREKEFNSLNYFEQTANAGSGIKADFSRQQFGGSVGGPVRKDKTFLFFAIERAREATSINVTGTAFNELSLVTNLGAQPVHSIPTPYHDWRYNGRIDHKIDDSNTFSASYSSQSNRGLNDLATSTTDLTAANSTTNELIIANATLNSVLTPTIVNSITTGYQYWHNSINASPKYLQLSFPSASFGTRSSIAQESVQRKWQFKDDIAINHGLHSFKMGIDYLWEPQLGGFFAGNTAPLITFFDNPSVILSNKTKYPQAFATPGAISGITAGTTAGNPYYYESAKMLGVYFQDDWKIDRKLALNLGLRWDKDYNLNAGRQQVNARAYQYLKAIGSSYAGGLPHDDNKDFSPRVGLSYDIKGNGNHTVRLGYGIYFGQTLINTTLTMLQQANSLLYTRVILSNSVLPGTTGGVSDIVPSTGMPLSQFRFGMDPLPSTPPPAAQLTGAAQLGQLINPKYRNPYTQQWNAGYTWAITSSSVLEVEYVHVLSLHESKSVIINPLINGVRFTSALFQAAGIQYSGPIQEYQASGRSRYDGMNLSYRLRLTSHLSVNASYVLSRGLAYNGNAAALGNSPTDFLNYYAPHDLGPTPADETHRLTMSGFLSLRWGFRLAPIVQWASGRPYNVTEGITDVYGYGTGVGATHAIVLNSDPNNLLGTASYNTGQLQACLKANTCDQVPYNFLRGGAFFEVDTRFSRTFKFGEKAKLELIFQAFDVTNRANFGANYQGNIRAANFRQPTNFITGSGAIVPKSFSGEFGTRFSF
jgi:hypothetical protein